MFAGIIRTEEKDTRIDEINNITTRMSGFTNKGELGILLAEEVQKYSIFELQVIGGRLNIEVTKLPPSYKKKVKPFFEDQIFGAYHELLSQYRSSFFYHLKEKIKDPQLYLSYCEMIPEGCTQWDETTWKNPGIWNPKNRLFYYLVAGYTMFITDRPGHPVGMPFPGGQRVEKRGNDYYCPIRDKEKDVFFSICNFCPAKQSEQ